MTHSISFSVEMRSAVVETSSSSQEIGGGGGRSCVSIRNRQTTRSSANSLSRSSCQPQDSSSSVSSSDDHDHATCATPTWIGKGLTCVCFKRKGAYERICINLTPLQEDRLRRLKHRMKVNFDASRADHQISFQRLLNKQGGKRATWQYPFSAAGVNITFMIMQMLDLESTKPRTFVRAVFIQMLSEDEWAFDLLYCVAFVVMDKQWLDKNATYMEFNDVLKSTRAQLERELLLDDVLRIEDMPSYGLLC
ncbi:uncharacterized protein LOC113277401 [Papaver somniferum]|uniref:uncharacterized protein LOC113277401 n=1 Tax=Papaver somniferum TaxID=3469 RepID=UPI000E7032DC|nr:uncharacterized protein LOC113277401 [Papaver somniferum]